MLSTPVVAYLAIAAALAGLIWMLRGSFLVFSLLCLPGTLAHELTHWMVGLISNARPSSLSIIPRRSGNTYVLGAVLLRNVNWYNGWLVGLSPLLLLPCACFIAVKRAEHLVFLPSLMDFGFIYLTAQMLIACLPSIQDVKVAVYHSWWIFPFFVLAAYQTLPPH